MRKRCLRICTGIGSMKSRLTVPKRSIDVETEGTKSGWSVAVRIAILYHASYPREFVNSGNGSSLTSDFVTKVVHGLADGRGNSSNGLGAYSKHGQERDQRQEHETG